MWQSALILWRDATNKLRMGNTDLTTRHCLLKQMWWIRGYRFNVNALFQKKKKKSTNVIFTCSALSLLFSQSDSETHDGASKVYLPPAIFFYFFKLAG